MSTLTAKLRHGFLEMLPPAAFFFVALHIVAIIRALMTHGVGISLSTTISVTFAALILGKSVLMANMLPFINRFPEKPLLWNVAWKTAIYACVALLVHYLERLHDYWKHATNLAAANDRLLAELDWAHFWAIQLLLVTLILNYCVIAELARVIGRESLKTMFLGPMPEATAARPRTRP